MVANENSGERKIKRFKVRERERGGSGKEGALLPSQTLLIFPRLPAARRTDPLTEGLEQATLYSTVPAAQRVLCVFNLASSHLYTATSSEHFHFWKCNSFDPTDQNKNYPTTVWPSCSLNIFRVSCLMKLPRLTAYRNLFHA